jgi:Immunity protein 8
MKAILKEIHSPDVRDLDRMVEVDKNHPFCVFVQAYFGSEGHAGTDSFGFSFCSVDYLEREAKEKGFVFGRSIIVVSVLSRQIIEAALTCIAEQIDGTDWADVANKLNRYGHWEFEDYRPYEAKS